MSHETTVVVIVPFVLDVVQERILLFTEWSVYPASEFQPRQMYGISIRADVFAGECCLKQRYIFKTFLKPVRGKKHTFTKNLKDSSQKKIP